MLEYFIKSVLKQITMAFCVVNISWYTVEELDQITFEGPYSKGFISKVFQGTVAENVITPLPMTFILLKCFALRKSSGYNIRCYEQRNSVLFY